MTNQSVNVPDGWSTTPGARLDSLVTYEFDVSPDERIVVGLTDLSESETAAYRLWVSTMEERLPRPGMTSPLRSTRRRPRQSPTWCRSWGS